MADFSTEITQLEAVINGATDSVTVDGVTTRWNLKQARKRLSELRAKDDTSLTDGTVRPRVAKLKLNTAW